MESFIAPKAVSSDEQRSWTIEKRGVLGGPCTVVKFMDLGRKLLVGKGSTLELFDNETGEELSRLEVFEGSSVHGVQVVDGDFCLAFGRTSLSFFILKSGKGVLSGVDNNTILKVKDWIWSVHVRKRNMNESTICNLFLALANNIVEEWTIQLGTDCNLKSDFTVVHRYINTTRCITYSICFAPAVADGLLSVASGTVFNEILLWVLAVTDMSDPGSCSTFRTTDCESIHRLLGHQGVVHSVKFNDSGKMLLSTSDDRSVRLWQQNESDQSWTSVWTAWSHTARVWEATFSSFGVVSIGEDATVRVLSSMTGSEIVAVNNYSCQSLWKLDAHGPWVAVGGNDGAVKLFHLESRVALSTPKVIPIPFEPTRARAVEEEEVDTKKKKLKKKKNIGQIVIGMQFIENGKKLVVAMRSGSALVYDLIEEVWNHQFNWKVSSVRGDGTCIGVNGDNIVFGTTAGEVLFLSRFNALVRDENKRFYKSDHKGIQSIKWVGDGEFATMHIRGVLLLWTTEGSFTSYMTGLDAIPHCVCVDKQNKMLIIGDARGNLVSFRYIEMNQDTMVSPLYVAKRYHGKEHVNDIAFQGDDFLVSVGNDGLVLTCQVKDNGELVRMTRVAGATLTGLSHVMPSKTGFESLVGGYLGNQFILVNHVTGHELVQVDTGGRQRQLTLLTEASRRSVIAILSNMKSNQSQNTIILHRAPFMEDEGTCDIASLVSKHGVVLHGEPVFDAVAFHSGPGSAYVVLVTGSEDCTARMCFMDNTLTAAPTSLLLPRQESGIRAVTSSRCSDSSTSLLVVAGGKSSVQFYLLDDRSSSHICVDLNKFLVHFLRSARYPGAATIDQRVNAVAATPLDTTDRQRSHLVITGDSSGSLFSFVVDETLTQPAINFVGNPIVENGRPILALQIFLLNDRVILLSGNTKGEICVWGTSSGAKNLGRASIDFGLVCTVQAHRMGTNCMSALRLGIDSFRVCSGGDDQALSVCDVRLDPKDGRATTKLLTIEIASESAINGIQMIATDLVVTVGYSQRLSIWRIADDDLGLVSSSRVDVADVNCLACCHSSEGHVLFAGGTGVACLYASSQAENLNTDPQEQARTEVDTKK